MGSRALYADIQEAKPAFGFWDVWQTCDVLKYVLDIETGEEGEAIAILGEDSCAIRHYNIFPSTFNAGHTFVHLVPRPSRSTLHQSTVRLWSTSEKDSNSVVKRSMACCTSCEPAVSRMECMDNIGLPTSTVRIPILDSIGPTVEPHDLH